jgi:hypothetical protein
MEYNIRLGCLSIVIIIVATYFGLNYFIEEDRKHMEQPVEVLCPKYANISLKNIPAKCIKYFNESEK